VNDSFRISGGSAAIHMFEDAERDFVADDKIIPANASLASFHSPESQVSAK
jgi:hypothetical protein